MMSQILSLDGKSSEQLLQPLVKLENDAKLSANPILYHIQIQMPITFNKKAFSLSDHVGLNCHSLSLFIRFFIFLNRYF